MRRDGTLDRDAVSAGERGAPFKPEALYEDNHVIVAVKPAMVPTQPDSSGDFSMLDAVKLYVKEKYHKPGEVYIGLLHRLDRPAAGVMCFARTSKAAARLSAQIADGRFEKRYLALLTGVPAEPSGELFDWLLKDGATNTVRRACADERGAKAARLEYETLSVERGRALVRVRLITGRSHQIRVQFALRGTPLYGDMRYGAGERGGLRLYSESVSFLQPVTGERLMFTSEPEWGGGGA